MGPGAAPAAGDPDPRSSHARACTLAFYACNNYDGAVAKQRIFYVMFRAAGQRSMRASRAEIGVSRGRFPTGPSGRQPASAHSPGDTPHKPGWTLHIPGRPPTTAGKGL